MGRGEASGSRECCAHGACGAKVVIDGVLYFVDTVGFTSDGRAGLRVRRRGATVHMCNDLPRCAVSGVCVDGCVRNASRNLMEIATSNV